MINETVGRLLRGAVGDILLRPWFDRAAVRILSQWYFPLSRAWAAGLAAGTDPDAFARELERDTVPLPLAVPALARLADLAGAHAAAVAQWEEALFGVRPEPPAVCAEVEAARHTAAHRLMAGRALFAPLHLASPVPPVRFAMAPAEDVELRHGARLADAVAAFAAPKEPVMWAESAPLFEDGARVWWLRRPAPVPPREMPDDRLWARVVEPQTAPGGPALVFTHGIAMEEEHWRGTSDPLETLRRAGLRLVLPEGPYHGRRRRPGSYGGEPVLAGGPCGLLDYLHAHVVELGLLVAWARRAGAAQGAHVPVAIGGVSLGALTAQLAAVAARHWPPEMRPDALFLVTPSRSLSAVAFSGSLTDALGVGAALRAAGWTEETVERWRPLLEPLGDPVMDPEHIVVVLGEADEVTPYDEGLGLAEAWHVPVRNVFIRPRGHFTSSLALARDTAPLKRLAAILRAGARHPHPASGA